MQDLLRNTGALPANESDTMPLTLGLTGMDPATEAALQAAFQQANAGVGGGFSLMSEADADYVVVDMDSMYGPMSWLRLHGAGKQVIGLTSAPRTQADFRLGRPFDSSALTGLLSEIAEHAGIATAPETVPAPALAPAPAPVPIPTLASPPPAASEVAATPPPAAARPAAPAPVVPAAVEELPAAPPSGFTHAPAPQDLLPEEVPAPPDAESAPPPAPEPAVVMAARDPVFLDWLAPKALSQRARYRRAAGPTLLVDPQSRQYHGPATLKPLAPCFEGHVRLEDFEMLDEATWTRESAAAGAAQPLSRLQWYGALLAGKGALLPGYDPSGTYRLTKWPQTEREFPKHFRIATAMMKGPATLDEIVAASGVPKADVADFINANLATGFAETISEPPPEPAETPKPSGLLGRLRGR